LTVEGYFLNLFSEFGIWIYFDSWVLNIQIDSWEFWNYFDSWEFWKYFLSNKFKLKMTVEISKISEITAKSQTNKFKPPTAALTTQLDPGRSLPLHFTMLSCYHDINYIIFYYSYMSYGEWVSERARKWVNEWKGWVVVKMRRAHSFYGLAA
jgi:hypothetical protein